MINKYVADKQQRKLLKGDKNIQDMQQRLINEEAEFNRHSNNMHGSEQSDSYRRR